MAESFRNLAAGLLLAALAPRAAADHPEPAFQRRCAGLAQAASLPEIEGAAWFNGEALGFRRWRPQAFAPADGRGRIVVLAFLAGPNADGAIRSLGRWWISTNRGSTWPSPGSGSGVIRASGRICACPTTFCARPARSEIARWLPSARVPGALLIGREAPAAKRETDRVR